MKICTRSMCEQIEVMVKEADTERSLRLFIMKSASLVCGGETARDQPFDYGGQHRISNMLVVE